MTMLLAALLASSLTPTQLDPAIADYRSLPAAEQPYYRYIYAPPSPPIDANEPPVEQAINWPAAISWAVCHSTQAVDLGAARPVKITPSLVRIDLRSLGWSSTDLIEVLKRDDYPYHAAANPLQIRGDWLIVQLTDSAESDAYLRMQFGDTAKLNRDTLLSKMEVDRTKARKLQLDHGMIETKSGVSKARTRILEFYPRLGGYASGTRDWFEIDANNSPLEFPDLEGLKHDGEEWIIGMPKYWPGGRGALQSYFLSDGSGKLVAEAPVRLVEDGTRFRGFSSIRYPGSCMTCHPNGLNEPTENGLRAWLADGIELKTDSKELQKFLDRWHLTGTATTIKRANEDNASAVEYACYGLDQASALRNFVAAVQWSQRPVSLEQAAAEAFSTKDELRRALAITSDRSPIGGHLAALAHGREMRRDTWASVYLTARQILDSYREANP